MVLQLNISFACKLISAYTVVSKILLLTRTDATSTRCMQAVQPKNYNMHYY